MGTDPITTGNIVLIIVGVILTLSGPYIIYRTVTGVLRQRRANPQASLHVISNGLNFVIAVLLFMAGVLFIINNLRGNPLA